MSRTFSPMVPAGNGAGVGVGTGVGVGVGVVPGPPAKEFEPPHPQEPPIARASKATQNLPLRIDLSLTCLIIEQLPGGAGCTGN